MARTKKQLIENLRLCFKDQKTVHIDMVASYVGKRFTIEVSKYADKDGYIKLF